MNYNKQSIERQIAALKVAVQMSKDIQEVVNSLKHYKQVNKKLTDALEEKGYWAYICKDKYSTKLTVSDRDAEIAPGDKFAFTIYVSEFGERDPITWEKIESELVRYDFQGKLDAAYQRLECFDIELVKFREFCEFVDKMHFKCFDLYKVKRELTDALKIASKV